MAYLLVPGDAGLDCINALFQHFAVVDVDVAGKRRVAAGIDLYHGVEKLADAPSVTAHGRADRDSEQARELFHIEGVALRLELVIHIEGHHHAQVHIYDLGGKVEVPFDVGGIHNVDYHVGKLFYEVFAHIELLGAVCRQGVCAGQVHEHEVVAAVAEAALLGIDGDPAVVAHMLVAAGGDVEKGGLSAVGVADEGHPDDVLALFRKLGHLAVEDFELPAVVGIEDFGGMLLTYVGARFGFAEDLYLPRLGSAQGYPVAEDFVFNRVLERGVLDDADLLARYEAHLYQPFAESTVAMYIDYDRAFASFQFRKIHCCPLFVVFNMRVTEKSVISSEAQSA